MIYLFVLDDSSIATLLILTFKYQVMNLHVMILYHTIGMLNNLL